MDELVKIHSEISKYKYQKDEATTNIKNLKEGYRLELVKECVKNLSEILSKEGTLSDSVLEIYLKNMSADVRNIYDVKG